ncbi:hypothetical protein ACI3PL_27085, partial [Lacticaseibacillus paracasei]
IIDESDPEKDTVTVVPHRIFQKAANAKSIIDSPEMPCKLKILKLMANSEIKSIDPSGQNVATAGFGLTNQATPLRTNGGATSK